ncbi:hypothetical protein [Lacinutrix cladophorae]
MNWKVKALLQKTLSFTKLGDALNHIPATLNKNYHYNVAIYQTYECIRKFSYCSIDLTKNKTALDFGTGYSLISSIVLSLLGFQKIITVDITKDISFSTLKKQVHYLDHPEALKLIVSKSIYTKKEILEKINTIKKATRLEAVFNLGNIEYIAPYTFKTLYKYSKKIDYIASQVVLEHVPPEILEQLFKFKKEVLLKDQFCVHTINFIDHFTNPGFFQDSSISEFNFLKYSNKYWKFWAGNSIAYTNRLSYLYYLELCKKENLKVLDFIGENYKEKIKLEVTQIHSDILRNYNPKINIEDIMKYQRGTLIISK